MVISANAGVQKVWVTVASECPKCGARFKVPALYVDNWCQGCFIRLAEMVKYQKAISLDIKYIL
jgi:hypothetical protein